MGLNRLPNSRREMIHEACEEVMGTGLLGPRRVNRMGVTQVEHDPDTTTTSPAKRYAFIKHTSLSYLYDT